MNFGWWKVRAGNPKAGEQESRRFLIPVLPEGFPHVKHFGMEPRPSHMVSGARPRRRSTHVPPHAWGDGAAFVPGNTTRAFSCNPHASPLGTLQPPRHTWCVCNALGKARPGALSRLPSNRPSAGSRASSVIGSRQSSSVKKSPSRTRARTIPSMRTTNGLASSSRTVLMKRFTVNPR